MDEIHVIMSERESEGACSLLTNGEIIGWWNHDVVSTAYGWCGCLQSGSLYA